MRGHISKRQYAALALALAGVALVVFVAVSYWWPGPSDIRPAKVGEGEFIPEPEQTGTGGVRLPIQ